MKQHVLQVNMGLTTAQLHDCMRLREFAKDHSGKLAASEEFIQEIMNGYVKQPASQPINLEILEAGDTSLPPSSL